MSNKIKRIYILNDVDAHPQATMLERFFPGAKIEYSNNLERLKDDLKAGFYPDAIFFDVLLKAQQELYELTWGAQNAKTVANWFRRNASDNTPRYFLFQSNEEYRAKNCLKSIKLPKRITPFVMHTKEIELATNLDRNQHLGDLDNEIKLTGFRDFLSETVDLQLPRTHEELADYRAELESNAEKARRDRSRSPERVLKQLKGIRADAIRSAMHAYIPRIAFANDEERERAEKLRIPFSLACGYSVSGYAAFSIDQVRELSSEGKPAILFLREYTREFIPYLNNIEGVALLDRSLTGHMSQLLRSYGVSGVLGVVNYAKEYEGLVAEDGSAIERAEYIVGQPGEERFLSLADALQKEISALSISGDGGKKSTIDLWSLEPDCSIAFGDALTFDIRPGLEGDNVALIPQALKIETQPPHDDLYNIKLAKKLFFLWGVENPNTSLDLKANIDSIEQIRIAQSKWIDIGLLRTERLLLADERQTHLLRKVILEHDAYYSILELNKRMAQQYFRDVFDKNSIYESPIRFRLLDLPNDQVFNQDERQKIEQIYGDPEIRGVQLGLALPALYEAQIQAIFTALLKLKASRGRTFEDEDDDDDEFHPNLEIMVSSVSEEEEMRLAREMITRIAEDMGVDDVDYKVGLNLDTPEAGVHIEAIIPHCDFISLGTNDLSSLILGYERGNCNALEGVMREHNISRTPDKALYPVVIEWILDVVGRIRTINPDIEIEVCGDHAEDIESLNALRECFLTNVSVAPNPYNLNGLPLLYDLETFDRATGPN